jgi:hypothetical protein
MTLQVEMVRQRAVPVFREAVLKFRKHSKMVEVVQTVCPSASQDFSGTFWVELLSRQEI